jgi:hypothetical protein
VLELTSKGYNQTEISRILQISNSTICRDLSFIREEAKNHVKKYIDERLPEEYEKCLVGLTAILKETWNISLHTENNRDKIQALSLAKECYSMKLELVTNATVVDDVIRFVKGTKNELASSTFHHGISHNETQLQKSQDSKIPQVNLTTRNQIF